MKVFGQLEKAQLENTTSDTASHPKGMITYRTDLNQAKVSNGTTYKLLIDEDSTQTLSNKTYASPSITGAITSAQTTTPANPASGSNKLYFKADGKLYTLDSAGNEAMVGSGTGGVKNLITNGNADDTSSSIFVPYADAAGTLPVDGTGGSPTVTTSVSTSSPLNGVKSFLLTKPASNVQGQGWAIPFTVDPAYRAKSLKISADFILNSGTFEAGFVGGNSDVIWYIYDVTNSLLIEPSNIKMFSTSSTIADKFEATFQTSATGSSYRLIAHVSSTSTSAYELKVDNITVSPQSFVFGSPKTMPQDYTPTIFGAASTSGVKFQYHRDGADGIVQFTFTVVTRNTADFRITLPAGWAVDTTRVGGSGAYVYGHATRIFSAGIVDASLLSVFYNSNYVNQPFIGRLSNGGSLLQVGADSTIANGDTISGVIRVPLAGAGVSTQMSDSADTRVVGMFARSATPTLLSGTLAAGTAFYSYTAVSDTHGAYGSGLYRIPVSGLYKFTYSARVSGSSTGGYVTAKILQERNASVVMLYSKPLFLSTGDAQSNGWAVSVTGMLECRAGDLIYPNLESNFTAGAITNDVTSNYLTMERLTGPSAISATESIAARYTTASAQSIASGATDIINFGTKDYDTHNAVTTGVGAWRFTAPATGRYRVAWTHITNGTGTAGYLHPRLYKNGASFSKGKAELPVNASEQGVHFYDEIYMLAGEYIEPRLHQTTGAARTLSASAIENYVTISRIGL